MAGPKLIAICGPKRAGKDTLASHLVSKYGYTRIALADPIKHVVGYMFGFNEKQMETDDKDAVDPRWGISPRQALQFFGTEVMQYKIQELLPDIGRMFWTRSMLANMDPEKNYVVSDVRFHHECDALRRIGATVIKIERDLGHSDAHSSEQEHKDIEGDITIVNDSTIDDMLSKIDSYMEINRI